MSSFEKLIVDVKVDNLARASDFYERVLGLEILVRAEEWVSFDAAGAEIHLYRHGGAKTGIEFRVRDVEDAVGHLKEKGVAFLPPIERAHLIDGSGEVVEHDWGKAAYFNDTEGNRLALIEDEK